MTSDLCPSPHKQPPDFLWTSDGAQKGQSSIDTASDFFVYFVYFVVKPPRRICRSGGAIWYNVGK